MTSEKSVCSLLLFLLPVYFLSLLIPSSYPVFALCITSLFPLPSVILSLFQFGVHPWGRGNMASEAARNV